METRDKIRNYLVQASMCEKEKIKDDTLIFEQGLLDSMGLLFLVQFLHDEFQVTTNDQELTTDNFESIDSIDLFVARKLKSKTPHPDTQLTA